MVSREEPKLGTLSTLSIGIGGMVGGGIFAVTGLTIEVTKGGTNRVSDCRNCGTVDQLFVSQVNAPLPRRRWHG